jgi:hypothetical protein
MQRHSNGYRLQDVILASFKPKGVKLRLCKELSRFIPGITNWVPYRRIASYGMCRRVDLVWTVASSLLATSRWFLARGFFYPQDGGDTFLRNVGSHNIYTVPHPRRRHSSVTAVKTSYPTEYLISSINSMIEYLVAFIIELFVQNLFFFV